MRVHTFGSTLEAYDASQTDDGIRDGDVLAVPSEGVYGLLLEAWPVAVTEERGSFHWLEEGRGWETVEDGRYAESARTAGYLAAGGSLPPEDVPGNESSGTEET
jgi:hypothetical protein